jgi:UDP-N-acetyl-2-amino-2-deoxyglucuronate dehydrogenase
MLSFALVGCGRIAPKHVDAIAALGDGARLGAVCDVEIERARAIGRQAQAVAVYSNLNEMLKGSPDIDVVNVLTPSGIHAEGAIKAAQAGKHVVVEKPMALRLEDADTMLEACDRSGVKLFVVKQNRYNLPVQQLRKALIEGRFGRLLLGTARVRWSRRQPYYDLASWRGTWAFDGGVFSNQASHHIDLLQWMMGPVKSVFAKTERFLVDIEAEDTGCAILRFESGALGLIEATTATRPRDLEGSLSVLGEAGTVEIGGFAVNEMRVWQFEQRRAEDEAILASARETPPTVYGFGHRAFMRNVADTLQSRGSALVDGLEGRKSVELIQAIYESAHTGREVSVPGETPNSPLGRQR